jgi:hypothetical protein
MTMVFRLNLGVGAIASSFASLSNPQSLTDHFHADLPKLTLSGFQWHRQGKRHLLQE